MSLYVLDTDIFSLVRQSDPKVATQLAAHQGDEITVSVITIEESLAGWFAVLRQARTPDVVARAYDGLAEVVTALVDYRILPYREPAIQRYQQFLAMRLNVRAVDLRLAAIALEHNAIVVTRNLRDFHRVPVVTAEDWAA